MFYPLFDQVCLVLICFCVAVLTVLTVPVSSEVVFLATTHFTPCWPFVQMQI